MKQSYYVSKIEQANGDHEVHTSSCKYLPASENRINLGEFDKCSDAVRTAKMYYNRVNGCYYCSKECHTS